MMSKDHTPPPPLHGYYSGASFSPGLLVTESQVNFPDLTSTMVLQKSPLAVSRAYGRQPFLGVRGGDGGFPS